MGESMGRIEDKLVNVRILILIVGAALFWIWGFSIGRDQAKPIPKKDPPAAEILHPGGAKTLKVDPEQPKPEPLRPGKRRTSSAILRLEPLPEVSTVQIDVTDEGENERITVKLPDGQEWSGVQIPDQPRIQASRPYRHHVNVWRFTDGENAASYQYSKGAWFGGFMLTDRKRAAIGGGLRW